MIVNPGRAKEKCESAGNADADAAKDLASRPPFHVDVHVGQAVKPLAVAIDLSVRE